MSRFEVIVLELDSDIQELPFMLECWKPETKPIDLPYLPEMVMSFSARDTQNLKTFKHVGHQEQRGVDSKDLDMISLSWTMYL